MDDDELSLWKQVYTETLRDLIRAQQVQDIFVAAAAAESAANSAVYALRKINTKLSTTSE